MIMVMIIAIMTALLSREEAGKMKSDWFGRKWGGGGGGVGVEWSGRIIAMYLAGQSTYVLLVLFVQH